MIFPLRTAFAAFQRSAFCVSIFICLQVLFTSLISSMTHQCFFSILFSFHVFLFIAVFFLQLTSGLTPLWSEKTLDIISALLNLLGLFCGLACDLSWGMFNVYLKRMYILLIVDGSFYIYLLSSSGLMYHLRPVFSYRFSIWMIYPLM